jgi:hypothetical protein
MNIAVPGSTFIVIELICSNLDPAPFQGTVVIRAIRLSTDPIGRCLGLPIYVAHVGFPFFRAFD